MFMSVDLPAPFSPRRACTSPGASSKSTPSFATTPGNRLVIPRSSRSGCWSAIGIGEGRASAPHLIRFALATADRVGDLDLSGDDLVDLRLGLLDRLCRRVGARVTKADAVVGETEGRHLAAGEIAVHEGLD